MCPELVETLHTLREGASQAMQIFSLSERAPQHAARVPAIHEADPPAELDAEQMEQHAAVLQQAWLCCSGLACPSAQLSGLASSRCMTIPCVVHSTVERM